MKLKLVKKIEEARGTKSYFFEPEKEIKWLPGQYYYYTLPELKFDDSRGPTRHFTIASSPTEGNLLMLTTRIREESGYKKTLDSLPLGSIVEGEGPTGTFILDESEADKNHIFLAGGIGITPFRSFIKYNIDKNLNYPMHIIYSNSLPEDFAYRKELEEWSSKFEFIKLSMTVSKLEESKEKWTGLAGRIDEKMVLNLTEKWKLSTKNSTFWVVGPPPFINAMEDMLEKLKIPSDNIRAEKFTGY